MTNLRSTKFPSVFDPFTIGFESLFDRAPLPTTGYPPYNILKTDSGYALEVAVAGFSDKDLTLEFKDGVLSIKGEKLDSRDGYVHKGIATRSFERRFTLENTLEVGEVYLKDGMLTVDLKQTLPEKEEPLRLEIKSR